MGKKKDPLRKKKLTQKEKKAYGLTQTVTRTYRVPLSFEGEDRREKRQNGLRANEIIAKLQEEAYNKIGVEEVDIALQLVRQNPELAGTSGARELAKEIRDGSNLGQISYLGLLGAAKGVIDREKKLQAFLDLMRAAPHAALEWYVLGRTPYLEKGLQYKLHLDYTYCRNLVMSSRRVFDNLLADTEKLAVPLHSFTYEQLQDATRQFCDTKITEINASVEITPRQQQFLQKIAIFQAKEKELLEICYNWLKDNEKSYKSRWKLVKELSRQIQLVIQQDPSASKIKYNYAYFSIIRGIIVTALAPAYEDGATVIKLMDTQVLIPENIVSKPFIKTETAKNKRSKTKLPLALIMGSKYVVARPGNAKLLTLLAKKDQQFAIQIWPPGKTEDRLTVTVHFHPKVHYFLLRGAKIKILILTAGDGPARKLECKVVLEGRLEIFLSQESIKSLQPLTSKDRHPTTFAIDVNKPGPFIVVGSDPILLPDELLQLCEKYDKLATPISQLSKKITSLTTQLEQEWAKKRERHLMILEDERCLVYAKRKRLLKEIHFFCARVVASALVQGEYTLFCVEDLHLCARGTRGALAKAILAMPDDMDFFERIRAIAASASQKTLHLEFVNPSGTSQGIHEECPCPKSGQLRRKDGNWDFVTCDACGEEVNTHKRASRVVRQRGHEQFLLRFTQTEQQAISSVIARDGLTEPS